MNLQRVESASSLQETTVVTKRTDWNLGQGSLMTLDFLSGVSAVLLAYALHPTFASLGWESPIQTQPAAFPASIGFSFSLIVCAHIAGLHDPLMLRNKRILFIKVAASVCVAMALYLLVLYFASLQQLGRTILVKSSVFSVICLTGIRVVAWRLAAAAPLRLGLRLNKERAEKLVNDISQTSPRFYPVLIQTELNAVELEATSEQCIRYDVQELIVSENHYNKADEQLWMECMGRGIQVTSVASFMERNFFKIPPEDISATWILSLDLKLSHPFYNRYKRLFDLTIASAGIILCSPILALAGLLIYLEDRGPVLYSQIRIGLRGAPYRIWKLRTMSSAAENTGPQWANKCDPRVMKIGRILRKTRIDEIPQFWNVLAGEMSFIGPRPERPEFVEMLAGEIPFYRDRHCIKPGITGWAQISFPYGASVEDAKQKLSYDLYYLKNASATLDILIILRTIGSIMKGSR